MPLAPQKTAQVILDSKNNYLGALEGNQSGLLEAVKTQFTPEQSDFTLNKGHGRIEKRTVSISQSLDAIPDFPGLRTLIRVESERQILRANIIEVSTETRYYVASYLETASAFGQRIRGYWGVENKVHYVRDVTQGEDASRTRTAPLIQIWAIARNVSLNLYRDFGAQNMAHRLFRKCTRSNPMSWVEELSDRPTLPHASECRVFGLG
jgi:predicted transposase YbfD/YdcC